MIDFLFNLKGRVSRKGYFLAFLIPYLMITELLPRTVPGSAGMLSILGLLLLFPAYVAIPVKRFHDMGVSGWYQAGVLGLIMLAAVITVQGVSDVSGNALIEARTPLEQSQVLLESVEQSPRAQLGLVLVVLVRIAQIVLFLSIKGQPGKNAYGNDPLASGRGFAD